MYIRALQNKTNKIITYKNFDANTPPLGLYIEN